MLHLLLELIRGKSQWHRKPSSEEEKYFPYSFDKDIFTMASKLKSTVCSFIDFFFFLFFFLAVSGRWRRENEVWLEGLCPATVRRKCELRIQLAFYCKCAPSRWA